MIRVSSFNFFFQLSCAANLPLVEYGQYLVVVVEVNDIDL
jgi:hypothetical protein